MSSLLFAANANEIYDKHYHKVDKTIGFIQGFPQVPLNSIVTSQRRNSLTNSNNFNSSLSNASFHLLNSANEHNDLNKEKEQYMKDLQNWKKAIYKNRTETFFVFPLPISLLASLPTYSDNNLVKKRAQKINYTQRPPLPMTYLSLFNTFNQTSTINLIKDRKKSIKLRAQKDKISNEKDSEENDENKSNSNSESETDSENNNDTQYHFVNNIEYIKDIEIPGPDYNSKFVNNKNSLEYIKVSDFCINYPKFGTKLIPQEPQPELFENYTEFKESLQSWMTVEKVTDEECQHPSSFWMALNGRNKTSTKKDDENQIENSNETDNSTQTATKSKNIFKKPERKPKSKIFSSLFYDYIKNPTVYPHKNKLQNSNENEESGNNDSILKKEYNLDDINENDINKGIAAEEQLLTLKGSLKSLLSFIEKANIKRNHPKLPNIKNAQVIINEFKAGSPHCYDFMTAIEEVSNNREINLKNYPEIGQEPLMKYSLSVQDNIKYELSTVSDSPVHRYEIFRNFLNALVGLNRYTMEMIIMFMAFPQITSDVADLFKCYGNLTDFDVLKFYGFKSNELSGSFNNLCQFLFEAQMLDVIERFFRKNEKVYHKNNPKFSSSLKEMLNKIKIQRITVLEGASKTMKNKFKEIEEDINKVEDYQVYKHVYENNNFSNNNEIENENYQILLHINNINNIIRQNTNEEINKKQPDCKVHNPLVFSVIHLLLCYLPEELISFFNTNKTYFLSWLLQLNYYERYYLGQICSHILCLYSSGTKLTKSIQMEFIEVMNLKVDTFATKFAFPTICHLSCQLLTIDTKTVLPADRITLLFTNTLKLIEIQHDCAITILESLCKIFKRRLKKKDSDYMDVFDMFFNSLVIPFNVDKFTDEFLEERMLSSVYNLFPYIGNEHQESTFKKVFIPKFISNDCDKANVAWKVFRRNPSHISKYATNKALINAIIQCIQEDLEKEIGLKNNRNSTIKPNSHETISTPSKLSRINPLISPSNSNSLTQSNHSQNIQQNSMGQLPQASPLNLSSSASHQTMPMMINSSPSPFDLLSSDREEKAKAGILRKHLSIVSKMHLLLYICGYSDESKKNDRSIKSMRIIQTPEVNALLDDVKDAIHKKIPEIYRFKKLVKSVKIAYRFGM